MKHQSPPGGGGVPNTAPSLVPLYYVKDGNVFKRPAVRRLGSRRFVEMGFRVCIPAETIGDEGAQFIAAALNAYDGGEP